MAGQSIIALASLVTLAGGIVLSFFVILAGVVSGTPENQIYFLQSTTNGITPQPRNPSRWTFFAICGADSNGHNANCGKAVPALPFDPPRNFGTSTGVPDAFIGTHQYFYLSRFMFAFYLVALFFAVIALFTGLLALCTRFGAYLSGLNTFMALFFQTLAAALMTAWTVLGRNHFRSAGQEASLGVKAYGFTWAAMACYLISTVLFCCAPAFGKKNEGYTSRRRGAGIFGRKTSTRSRRSVEIGGRNHIKDDYS